MNTTSKLKKPLIAIVLLLGIGVAAWQGLSVLNAPAPGSGGDFTLQSADGPLALHDLSGKVVVIFFGFTQCPIACPTAMRNISEAFSQLSPAEQDKTHGLLITIDPERDTPELLKEYTAHFHANITGLSGSPQAIAQVAAQYNVTYEKVPATPGADYSMDHTTFLYFIDTEGRLSEISPSHATTGMILTTVRKTLGD